MLLYFEPQNKTLVPQKKHFPFLIPERELCTPKEGTPSVARPFFRSLVRVRGERFRPSSEVGLGLGGRQPTTRPPGRAAGGADRRGPWVCSAGRAAGRLADHWPIRPTNPPTNQTQPPTDQPTSQPTNQPTNPMCATATQI